MNNLIELKNICFEYDKKENADGFSLESINLEIPKKGIIAIVGESGSGKTTLGKLLAGLLKPGNGSFIKNYSNSSKVSPVQILFQNSVELINPYRTASKILQTPQKNNDDIISLINFLGLYEDILEKRGSELSGGERQRVALARLLLAEPQLLILDEPFSAQDVEAKQNILDLLLKVFNEFQISYVIISHDIKILDKIAERIAVMYNGKIVESADVKSIFQKPLHPYTYFLIKASEQNLEKDDINFNNIKKDNYACDYYNKCPIRIDKCKTKVETNSVNEAFVLCNKPGELNV